MRHGHNEVQKEDDGWGKIHIIDGMGQGGGGKRRRRWTKTLLKHMKGDLDTRGLINKELELGNRSLR